MTQLHDMTVAQAGALIAARALSPVELVDAILDRIDAVDPVIRSAITVTADRARAQARVAEAEIAAGRSRGPLHGIPYGLKDNFFTAGIPSTGNSRLLAGHLPDYSATAHDRLEAAGAILVAKLATYEFGTGTGSDSACLPFPAARNPWNPDHFTGGSSTGSGAAVAAGTVLFALGADTGGSIRLPAAGCGVHGLKASYGLVSRAGVLPNAWSLDHIGPLTRTAEDCALVLDAIAAHDPRDPASADLPRQNYAAGLNGDHLRGMRVGVIRAFDDPAMDPDLGKAFEDVVRLLLELGASVTECDPGASRQSYLDCARIINTAECFAIHQRAWREGHALMGPALLAKLDNGVFLSAADYLGGQRWRRQLNAGLAAVSAQYDVILSAAIATPAPLLADGAAVTDFTTRSAMAPFSLSGQPAMAIPAGFSRAGLPLSVQLAAVHFQEARLLQVAHLLDRAMGWSRRRPRIPVTAPATVAPPLPMPPVDAASRDAMAALARKANLANPSEQRLTELAHAAARMETTLSRMPQSLPETLEPETPRLCR